MKRIRNTLILLGLIISFSSAYSQDYTKEELDKLRKDNLITQEVYEILLSELGLGSYYDEDVYSLSINGEKISKDYKVMLLGGEKYFPILEFIELLKIKNYQLSDKLLVIEIGENLKRIEIDFVNKEVRVENKKISLNFLNDIKKEGKEIFIKEDIFKKLFLNELIVDDNYSKISMSLNFNAPEIVEMLRKKTEIELKNEEEKEEKKLIYTNNKKLIELGNLRVNTYVEYEKDDKTKESETDYVGEFEYQGSLLYGEITTGYDTKINDFTSTYLTYRDILAKDYELKVGSYYVDKEKREWGLSLEKNRGYFKSGRNYVIEYDVPIGSKVELLYYGIPIAIEDAVNGKVRFENSKIEEDRTYTLRITEPSGKIDLVEIKTSPIYNIQNKGEFEYDLDIREDYNSKKIRGNGSIFYGITEKLTLGTSFDRSILETTNKYKYLDKGRIELTYNNYFYEKYPYVLKGGIDKILTSGIDESGYSYSDRYTNDILFQVDINDLTLITSNKKYGKYYSEENEYNLNLVYDVSESLRLEYDYTSTQYRRENRNEYYNLGVIEYNYNLGKFLFSNGVGISDNKDENYLNFDIYIGSWFSNTISLENKWIGKDMEYEGKLNLYNGDLFSGFDYNFSVEYSEKERERLTFEFELDLENIFNFEMDFGNKGSRRYKAGIDTVIDLRNITEAKSIKDIKFLESIDSTNVKAITFVDENGNNVYDVGEELLKNVEVKIAGERKNTDKNGEVYFYGIPSNTEIQVETLIRRPSYTLGNTTINIQSKGTGSVTVYIPIKPMMTLQGILDLDKGLNLSAEEKRDLYDNIIIQVKDKKGRVIESTLADENGEFIVSGLFTEEYLIEAEYVGTKFKIKGMKENIKLAYNKNSIQDIRIAMLGNKITLNK